MDLAKFSQTPEFMDPRWQGAPYKGWYMSPEPFLLVPVFLSALGLTLAGTGLPAVVPAAFGAMLAVALAVIPYQMKRRRSTRYVIGDSTMAIVRAWPRESVETRKLRGDIEIFYRRHRNGTWSYYFGGMPPDYRFHLVLRSDRYRQPFFRFELVENPEALHAVLPHAGYVGWFS